MISTGRMRCYLLAVRCLRSKCCLIIFLIGFVLLLGRLFQHNRSAFFLSMFKKNGDEYNFFQVFSDNFSKSQQFTPGKFLSSYIRQNVTYCNFKFGLPEQLNINEKDIEFSPELGLDSMYRVVYNVVVDSTALNASAGVTYCTHATPEFFYFIVEVLQRWQGPVSVAAFVPSTDASLIVCVLERLCSCYPEMARVSLHFVFPVNYPPKLSTCPKNVLLPEGCSTPQGYIDKTITTFRSIELLTYPVNVARNAARMKAHTGFMLVADVELLPNKNLVINFMKMVTSLQEKSGFGFEAFANKMVYVVPVFEVQSTENVPETKSQLLELYSQNQAFYFHRWVCSHCQRFPGLQRWLLRKSPLLDTKIEPFFVVRREFPFHRWEPVFIGTNADPLYSELLTWEGLQDKMTQRKNNPNCSCGGIETAEHVVLECPLYDQARVEMIHGTGSSDLGLDLRQLVTETNYPLFSRFVSSWREQNRVGQIAFEYKIQILLVKNA